MPNHTLFYQCLYITFVNSKSFFKASDRPNILLTTTFAGYQINNIFTVTLQNSLNFIFPLVSKASKVRRNYSKLLADVTLLLNLFIEHSFCLLVLGNNDGDKISLRLFFLLYVTLMILCGKISSICWLLYKIGKWFLMIVLRLGNKGLYCVNQIAWIRKSGLK